MLVYGMQTSGEALYTSDIGLGGSELHAVPVLSSQALATLENIDASKALKVISVQSLSHNVVVGDLLQHSKICECWNLCLLCPTGSPIRNYFEGSNVLCPYTS